MPDHSLLADLYVVGYGPDAAGARKKRKKWSCSKRRLAPQVTGDIGQDPGVVARAQV